MKKKLLLIVLCVVEILYLQFGRSAVINHTTTDFTPHGYDVNLTITVNKLFIINREKLAKDLVQQVIDNDFKNMQLSYDVHGYPNELMLTVYINSFARHLQIPAFRIKYVQETPYKYNLKDNPEKFTILFE